MRARFVRVQSRNTGICPAWHRGAGNKAWLFADEITIVGKLDRLACVAVEARENHCGSYSLHHGTRADFEANAEEFRQLFTRERANPPRLQ